MPNRKQSFFPRVKSVIVYSQLNAINDINPPRKARWPVPAEAPADLRSEPRLTARPPLPIRPARLPLRRVVAALTAVATFAAQLPVAALTARPAAAQLVMTRADYEACQAQDETAFRKALPGWITVRVGHDRRSAAAYCLNSQTEIVALIARLDALVRPPHPETNR